MQQVSLLQDQVFTQFLGLLTHSREEFEILVYTFKSKQIFTAIIFVALSLVILITTNITKDIPLKDLKSEFKNESSRFVEVDGILVHYTDEGEGTPIILLHGTGASLHTWDLWAEKLKENYRVLRITLPGFGLSGPRLDKRYEIRTTQKYSNSLHGYYNIWPHLGN